MVERRVSQNSKGHWESYALIDGLPDVNVLVIFEDKEGYLWFGTEGGGASRYDGESFVTFTAEDGLAHNNIRAITEDKEGYLWFGTNGGGVCKYDSKNFQSIATRDGLAYDTMRQIIQDKATPNLIHYIAKKIGRE